jgi:hypothetical protein
MNSVVHQFRIVAAGVVCGAVFMAAMIAVAQNF